MCTYKIKSTEKTNIAMNDPVWETAEVAKIDKYVWDETGCTPCTEVRVLKGPDGFYLKYISDEHPVLARYKNPNDPVCKDSCAEFFINAAPQSINKYINFEINALGTPYMGFGIDRSDSGPVTEDISQLQIETEVTETGWKLKFFIPNSLLEKYFGKIEKEMRGNFYKCSDDKAPPHYGSWAPINSPDPDFHRPEWFGNIIID